MEDCYFDVMVVCFEGFIILVKEICGIVMCVSMFFVIGYWQIVIIEDVDWFMEQVGNVFLKVVEEFFLYMVFIFCVFFDDLQDIMLIFWFCIWYVYICMFSIDVIVELLEWEGVSLEQVCWVVVVLGVYIGWVWVFFCLEEVCNCWYCILELGQVIMWFGYGYDLVVCMVQDVWVVVVVVNKDILE